MKTMNPGFPDVCGPSAKTQLSAPVEQRHPLSLTFSPRDLEKPLVSFPLGTAAIRSIIKDCGSGQMAQWLRATAAIPERPLPRFKSQHVTWFTAPCDSISRGFPFHILPVFSLLSSPPCDRRASSNYLRPPDSCPSSQDLTLCHGSFPSAFHTATVADTQWLSGYTRTSPGETSMPWALWESRVTWGLASSFGIRVDEIHLASSKI